MDEIARAAEFTKRTVLPVLWQQRGVILRRGVAGHAAAGGLREAAAGAADDAGRDDTGRERLRRIQVAATVAPATIRPLFG
jgi:hypothetical protein